MNVIIFGGFLGSGKTTAVLQLARCLVEYSAVGEHPVVILENEIGEVGVDDMLLRSNGYKVSELFSGCACCTMAGELRGNVRQIQKDLEPEWLIVEATGVALPERIRETIQSILDRPVRICTLVDAQRFLRMLIPAKDLIEAQVSCADCILINKIDLVDQETLQTVTDAVRARNADGILLQIQASKPMAPTVWKPLLERFTEKEGQQ